MSCRCAPSLIVLRNQVDARWPERDKASDGCCASVQHHQQNAKSDHEPDVAGFAHALDIDADLAPGVAVDVLTAGLLDDPRTKYVIRNARLLYPDGTSKPYTGINAHRHHLHLSIKSTATFDAAPWSLPPPAAVTPVRKDPHMKVVIEAEDRNARWLIGCGVARHIGDINELGQLEEAWGKAEKTLARSVILNHGLSGVHQ